MRLGQRLHKSQRIADAYKRKLARRFIVKMLPQTRMPNSHLIRYRPPAAFALYVGANYYDLDRIGTIVSASLEQVQPYSLQGSQRGAGRFPVRIPAVTYLRLQIVSYWDTPDLRLLSDALNVVGGRYEGDYANEYGQEARTWEIGNSRLLTINVMGNDPGWQIQG